MILPVPKSKVDIGRLRVWLRSTPTMVSPYAGEPEVAVAVEPNGGGTARMREVITGITVATCGDWRTAVSVASVIAFGPAARRSSV